MDERKLQFRVGVTVLAALLITGILVALFGNVPMPFRKKTTIHVWFSVAPGAVPDTPVRKSGILIGRVSDIKFDENDTGVIVTVKIDGDRTVYEDEKCIIVNSLIGIGSDTVLEFVRRPGSGPHRPIPDGARIRGEVAGDPTRAIVDLEKSLGETMGRVKGASDALGDTFHRIDSLLSANEEQINSVVRESGKTLVILKDALNNINDVIGDKNTRDGLKDAIKLFPKTLADASDTAQQMAKAMKTVQTNLKNLEPFTKPLGDRGEMLVQRLSDGADNFNKMMKEMRRFSGTLNDPNNTLSQLANNPELVRHLTRAAKNIDELIRQLQPILDDARVFSDKIARHPEVLGVRGAIQRSPGIK
jgi:phospholipid/cholesterol/gamma-HCH transport system substrate-binding protein